MKNICELFSKTVLILPVIMILLHGCVSTPKSAKDLENNVATPTGTVCQGPNLSKVAGDSSNTYLKINDSQLVSFHAIESNMAKVFPAKLDLRKKHKVFIYYKDDIVENWILDFAKFPTNMVKVWRTPGGWKMSGVKECK